jgi:broad specificity phosphatase PhoE
MQFYLIRHGQTDWNIGRRIQGETDVPLNARGRLQAEAAGRAMREVPIDAIYSSDLSRALETARAVSRLHDGGPLPVTPLREFEEVSFGEWEGMSLDEVGEKWPELFARWKQNATAVTPPGGETPDEVRERVSRGFQKIGADWEKTPFSSAVITAHGAVLEYIFDWLLRNASEHREIIVENASISRISYDFATEEGRILELNRVDHLGELRGKKLV